MALPMPVRDQTWAAWNIDELLGRRPSGYVAPTQVDYANTPSALTRALETWGVAGVTPATIRRDAPTTALDAVDFIAVSLQVSRDRVRTAAGIAERTYHGWKSGGHKPREKSVARLWAWVHVVTQLLEARPTLAAWFHADASAQAALDAGDVNAFAAAELSDSVRGVVHRPVVPFDLPAEQMGYELPSTRPVHVEPVTLVISPRRGVKR